MLRELPYERGQALEYARRWALGRNPLFYNFTGQGGDCTNFISQCLLAGCLVMNCRETFGWYYHSPRLRAPAWTGVQYLWNFLSGNAGAGPYGREAELAELIEESGFAPTVRGETLDIPSFASLANAIAERKG